MSASSSSRSLRVRVGRHAFAWGAAWVFSAALYLLLIDITDLPELIVGAGAAVLAATGAELAREQGIVGEAIRARWLARLYRLLLSVPRDTAVVSLLALRAVVRRPPSQGEFRVVAFEPDDDSDARARGRRALAETVGSVAPNTFVIGIDEERGLLLAHQLRPTPGRQAIDPLELG